MNIKNYYEVTQKPWTKMFYSLVHGNLPGLHTGARVLDFGSGFGITADYLGERYDVTAVEPCIEMFEFSKRRSYPLIDGSLDVLEKMIAASFDLIICHNVLEYLESRKEYLLDFSRLLKPGGYMSVVKHNPAGRIYQKAILENNPKLVLELLGGAEPVSDNFGLIPEYMVV